MVPRFTDEQQNSLPIIGLLLEQIDRVVDRVEDGGSGISRLQIGRFGVDPVLVGGEVSRQSHLAVELYDRNPRCSSGKQGIEHRVESLHAGKFVRGATPALNRYYQRDG